MKSLTSLLLSVFCITLIYAQNPYESIGIKDIEVLTLSNGKYHEFFTNDTLVQIGSAVLNTKTKKIVSFVELDSIEQIAGLKPHLVSRWVSPDPLAEKYIEWSPYSYVMNNPIIFIDPDGQKVELANNHAGAMTNIAQIAATTLGSQVMNQLISNPKTYTMRSTFFSLSSEFNPDSRNIDYVGNPWHNEVPRDGGAWSSMVAMSHESWHAYDHTEIGFTKQNVEESFNLRNACETKAVSFANYMRDAYSLEPSRNQYSPYDGDFNQFTGGGVSEKVSDFTTLGSNEDGTSMGFSYTKTTKTVLSYKTFGVFKVPDETKTETANYYMTVSMDANNNVSFQIFDNVDDYNNSTSNW